MRALFSKGFLRPSLLFPVLLCLVVVGGGQLVTGAAEGEFGGHPDEAAHVVTGLMIRDYVAAGFPGNPMAFAKDYYAHWPKVALGNWPPGLYLLQFPASLAWRSPGALLLTQVAILTALAAVLLHLFRPVLGKGWALAACLYFLLLPITLEAGSLVMTEAAVALWTALAVTFWARWVGQPGWKPALGFAAAASAAILTKGSGLALALVPPLTLLFLGRRGLALLREPTLWLSAVAVAVACAPWTVATLDLARAGWAAQEPGWGFTREALPYYAARLAMLVGVPVALYGLSGIVLRGIALPEGRRNRTFWAAISAWAVAVPLLHAVVPAGMEPRHLLPALPAWIALALGGVNELARTLAQRLGGHVAVFQGTLLGVAVGWFVIVTLAVPVKEWGGFDEAHAKVALRDPSPGARFLVSSDARGEGMFIAAAAYRDRARTQFVDRASKSLAESAWSGAGYSGRFDEPEALARFLEESGYRLVVVDTTVPASRRRPHHDLLEQTLASQPRRFTRIAELPARRPDAYDLRGLKLYLVVVNQPGFPR